MVQSNRYMQNPLIKKTFPATDIHPNIFQGIMAIEVLPRIKLLDRLFESFYNRIPHLLQTPHKLGQNRQILIIELRKRGHLTFALGNH